MLYPGITYAALERRREILNSYIFPKLSGLSGYVSEINKCDYIMTNSSKTILRKRHLFLRDLDFQSETVEGKTH